MLSKKEKLKKKYRDRIWTVIIGVLLVVASVVLINLEIDLWMWTATFGIWLLCDYLSSLVNKNTSVFVLRQDKKEFFRMFLLLFMFGCSIELIGNILLRMWHYAPAVQGVWFWIFGLIAYPFILLSFRELYAFFKTVLRRTILAVPISMIIGIIIWEIPNLAIYSWTYTVPYVDFEILHVNIVVIVGWIILIALPSWMLHIYLERRWQERPYILRKR